MLSLKFFQGSRSEREETAKPWDIHMVGLPSSAFLNCGETNPVAHSFQKNLFPTTVLGLLDKVLVVGVVSGRSFWKFFPISQLQAPNSVQDKEFLQHKGQMSTGRFFLIKSNSDQVFPTLIKSSRMEPLLAKLRWWQQLWDKRVGKGIKKPFTISAGQGVRK